MFILSIGNYGRFECTKIHRNFGEGLLIDMT